MFTIQELIEAVAEYQPIDPATIKGWTYGIKGFEDKKLAEVDKKRRDPSKVTAEPFGNSMSPATTRTLLGYCGTICQIWFRANGDCR